ncbi:Methyltransf-25 domain-containing protein [Favolaschia claudopus]|uniref:Methyltransf-25 domain-containing protein n=1 Tax=Favolaschia claudopus TaxID=2862362 RepID=A0AAV9ZFV9_9AGAR
MSIKMDYSTISDADVEKMEQMSSPSATALLVQTGLLPVPPSSESNPVKLRILDLACGAGVITSLFFNSLANTNTSNAEAHVACGDLEPQMVKLAQKRIERNGWNAEAVVLDAQAMPFPDNHFTHVLMNMGIQVVPDQARVIQESFRVLAPSGLFGMTSASTPGWLPLIHAALGSSESFTPPPMFTSGPLLSPATITSFLTDAGFTQVEVKTLEFDTTTGVEEHLVMMRRMLGGEGGMLGGEERWGRYEGYVRGRFGEGEVRLRSEMFVTTARKG